MNLTLKMWLALVCLLLGTLTASLAQSSTETEKIEIDLTDPGKPGMLQVTLLHGSIKVTGYNGKKVIVGYATRGERNVRHAREESEGLRRLPNNTLGLEVRESNNNVSVKNSAMNRGIDLDIKVPFEFSVKLKTLNDGVITVEDLRGELDVDNLNGHVYLKNVSGSASASTLNGNIQANFQKVTPNKPMAFSNLNGKIDVTFPANTKFDAKMKTDNGDIFTDFDVTVEKNQVVSDDGKDGKKSDANSEKKSHRIYIDKWTSGKINGGGPEILFKNFNGNIYIRKSK